MELYLYINWFSENVKLFTVILQFALSAIVACEQALLFGRLKRVSRERASGARPSLARSRVLARLASLAQIGDLARRLVS